MTHVLIRDVPDSVIARIHAEAFLLNLSRQEFLLYFLDKHFGNSPTVYGYIAVDKQGDFDAACPRCGKSLTNPFMWFATDGTTGIVCESCADSVKSA